MNPANVVVTMASTCWPPIVVSLVNLFLSPLFRPVPFIALLLSNESGWKFALTVVESVCFQVDIVFC